MLLPRTKLVEEFQKIFLANEHQYIAIVGASGSGKSSFIELLQNTWILDSATTEYANSLDIDSFQIQKPKTIVFDSSSISDISYIRTFIESNLLDSRVIYTTEKKWIDTNVTYFILPWISFREYAEWSGTPVDVGAILSWTANIDRLNTLRDAYIHVGQYGYNISNPDSIDTLWDDKISIMVSELFEKEKDDFIEFIRTLALGVWELFKEDKIAKMMNISRRKVRKYTEVLLKYDFIHAVWPFWDYPETELFRHVKLYFSDLSYLSVALGVAYYHGMTRQWVLENFVLLELERKVSDTHDIKFYRKKSGAEISFVLVERDTGDLTPIDISPRSTDIIPQPIRIFTEVYGSRLDHIMFLNEEKSAKREIDGYTVFIFPHVAI